MWTFADLCIRETSEANYPWTLRGNYTESCFKEALEEGCFSECQRPPRQGSCHMNVGPALAKLRRKNWNLRAAFATLQDVSPWRTPDKWQTLCFSATTITTTKLLTGLVIAELLLLLAWRNAREASHRLSLLCLCVSFWESLHISGLESRLSSAMILGQALASVPARPTGRRGRSKDFMKEEHLLRTASGCPSPGQTPSYVCTSGNT